ncbi:MAG: phosphatidate cytidylyltransferase [Lachnospiraceae bacterium]|nr:phosphatidate cytidylyltransferase [Lachnospiraceae bacterium]
MFRTRLISGIVLVVCALALIITGGNVLLVSTLLLSIIGLYELMKALKMEKTAIAYISYLMTLFYYLNLKFRWISNPVVYTIIFLIVILAAYVLGFPKYSALNVMGGFFGFFYVSAMLSFIYLTRDIPVKGKYYVWLIFLCAWGSDTFAYCAGRLFGKHKMAPVLSPKKTVEGALGGIIGAALLTMGYSYYFKMQLNFQPRELILIGVIGAVGALVSMIGDLAASAIKREYDIKDYGKLIPGHGGVLDRFDSIIITAPIVYFLALTLVHRI